MVHLQILKRRIRIKNKRIKFEDIQGAKGKIYLQI